MTALRDRAEAAERKVRALQEQVKNAHDCMFAMAVDSMRDLRRTAAKYGEGTLAYNEALVDAYVAGLVFLTRESEKEIRAKVEKAADKEQTAKAAG